MAYLESAEGDTDHRNYFMINLNLNESCGWAGISNLGPDTVWSRPRGYKTFFMFNSAEQEICFVYKS